MSNQSGRDEMKLASEAERRRKDDEARLVAEAVKWFKGMQEELNEEDLAVAMFLNAELCDRLEREILETKRGTK
jgi:hypothetical protein